MSIRINISKVNLVFFILVIVCVLISMVPITNVLLLDKCAFFVKFGELCPRNADEGIYYYLVIDIIAIAFVLAPSIQIKKK